MPQPNVCDLLKDQRFEGFLLVRSSDQRTGGNGAKYLDLNLADRTGEVNAKVWDGNVPPPPPGSVVKVRGGTLEYNGRLQLRVERIRAMAPHGRGRPLGPHALRAGDVRKHAARAQRSRGRLPKPAPARPHPRAPAPL